MTDGVGYEMDKLLVDPIEYWIHRIAKGRRVAKWGPFLSEAACRGKAETLLVADRNRLHVVPPEDVAMIANPPVDPKYITASSSWHTGLDDVLEKHHDTGDHHDRD